jgi:hypothetical protein
VPLGTPGLTLGNEHAAPLHLGEDAHAALPADQRVVVGDQQFVRELRIGDDDLMLRPDPEMHDVAELPLPRGQRAKQVV